MSAEVTMTIRSRSGNNPTNPGKVVVVLTRLYVSVDVTWCNRPFQAYSCFRFPIRLYQLHSLHIHSEACGLSNNLYSHDTHIALQYHPERQVRHRNNPDKIPSKGPSLLQMSTASSWPPSPRMSLHSITASCTQSRLIRVDGFSRYLT